MGKTYDVALILGIDPGMGSFSPALRTALHDAVLLRQSGTIDYIIVSGKFARKYNDGGIKPWFDTEAQWMCNYLRNLGCPRHAIITEKESQDTIANLVNVGPILRHMATRRVLLIGPAVRQSRLASLCSTLLAGVATVTYVPIAEKPDLWTRQKEPFTQAVWQWWLDRIPKGAAGWPAARSWFYDGQPYVFWKAFDTTHGLMTEAATNTNVTPLDVMTHTTFRGLPPGFIAHAVDVAKRFSVMPAI